MSDTMGLIAGIGLAVVIAVILMKFAAKNKANSWSGTVTNVKRHVFMNNDIEEEEFIVFYKTDDGKNGKLRLSPYQLAQHYPGLQAGDRLIKESGEFMPKKG